MALVPCAECGAQISDQAHACPHCGHPLHRAPTPITPPATKKSSTAAWLGALAILVFFAWCFSAVRDAVDDASTSITPARSSVAAVLDTTPSLEVTAWSWHHEYGYAIAEGQVRNLTAYPIDDIEAVVSFHTADGTFISSDDALIDYRPLLPGQASPFKVMATWNPSMAKAGLGFAKLGGRPLTWREVMKTKKTR